MRKIILERNRRIYAHSTYCIPITFFENTDVFPLYPTGMGILDCRPDYYIKRREDRGFSLIYVLDGKMKLVCGGSSHTMKKNDMALVNLKQYHEFCSPDGSAFRYFFVNFIVNPGGKPTINLFSDYFSTPVQCTTPSDTNKTFAKLSAVAHEPSADKELMPYTYLSLMLSDLYRDITIDKTRSKYSPSWGSEVISYLESHYSEKINFQALADEYSKSSYAHFSRCFKNATGSSPSDYLNNVRLSRAKELLLYSNTPVEIIAYKTGFSNPSRFISAFKKQNNLTPHKFRTYRSKFKFSKKPVHKENFD